MRELVQHLFENIEVYVVALSWITVPLGFYVAYRFLSQHYGMFDVPRPERD